MGGSIPWGQNHYRSWHCFRSTTEKKHLEQAIVSGWSRWGWPKKFVEPEWLQWLYRNVIMAVNVAQLKGVVSKLDAQLKYDKRAPFVLRKVLSSLALIDAGTWDARLCKRSAKSPSMWWVSICLVMCFKQMYMDCVDFFMRVLYCCSGCTIVIYSVRRQMFVAWTSVSSSKQKEPLTWDSPFHPLASCPIIVPVS